MHLIAIIKKELKKCFTLAVLGNVKIALGTRQIVK